MAAIPVGSDVDLPCEWMDSGNVNLYSSDEDIFHRARLASGIQVTNHSVRIKLDGSLVNLMRRGIIPFFKMIQGIMRGRTQNKPFKI